MELGDGVSDGIDSRQVGLRCDRCASPGSADAADGSRCGEPGCDGVLGVAAGADGVSATVALDEPAGAGATIPLDTDSSAVVDSVPDVTTLVGAPLEVMRMAREPGRTLGRFVLLEQVGAGGMGVVFRAWDSALAKHVAIKLLRPPPGEDPARAQAFVERFLREARTVAQLEHPNICRVLDVGRDGERYYLAMPLLDGEPLSELSLQPRALAAAMIKICRAIHHAHERGVIHRDIKSANVMIDREGEPFVMDFGIAKREDANSQLTQDGAIIGSPAFMAPEQASGGRADVQSDVYSLGATLYHGLCGELPFDSDNLLKTLTMVASAPLVPPSRRGRRPQEPALERVCLRAMSRKRRDRYASAEELAAALEAALAGQVAPRPTTGVRRRTRSGSRASRVTSGKHRSRAGRGAPANGNALWVAGGALALGLLLVGLLVFGGKGRPTATASSSPASSASSRESSSAVASSLASSASSLASSESPPASSAASASSASARLSGKLLIGELDAALARRQQPAADHAAVRQRLQSLAVELDAQAEEASTPALTLARARARLALFDYRAGLELLAELVDGRGETAAAARELRARALTWQVFDALMRYGFEPPAPIQEQLDGLRKRIARDLRVLTEGGDARPELEALIALAEQRRADVERLTAALIAGGGEPVGPAHELRGLVRSMGPDLTGEPNETRAQRVARLQGAVSDLDQALTLRPGAFYARVFRAHLIKRGPRWVVARKDVETALDMRPDFAVLHWFLGTIFHARAQVTRNMRTLQRAERSFNRGLTVDKASFTNLIGLAVLCASRRQHQRAFDLLTRALKINPSSYVAHLSRAKMSIELGRADAAHESLAQAKQARPQAHEPYYLESMVYYRQRKFREAAAAIKVCRERGFYPPHVQQAERLINQQLGQK